MARTRRRPGRTPDRAGRGRLSRRYDRPFRARRASPFVRHLCPDMTGGEITFSCGLPDARAGVSEDEVTATIREGERFAAKFGREGFRRNFSYDSLWRGRRY